MKPNLSSGGATAESVWVAIWTAGFCFRHITSSVAAVSHVPHLLL